MLDIHQLSARRYGAVVVAIPSAREHEAAVHDLRLRLHNEGDHTNARMAVISRGFPWPPLADEHLPAIYAENQWRGSDMTDGVNRLLAFGQHQWVFTPLLDEGWFNFIGRAMTATIVPWLFIVANTEKEAREKLSAAKITRKRVGEPIDLLTWPFA